MMVPSARETVDARSARTPDAFIPAGWKLQPADPNFAGRRYMAPDGSAWLALYSVKAEPDALQAHLKAVAFADGETVTQLRGERDWLAVSGTKDDKVFYRKVALACGGTTWRHVAFEYPARDKQALDRVVEQAAHAFDRVAAQACGADMFSAPKE